MHIVYAVMAKEYTEPIEEKLEASTTKETLSVGHIVNMFNCILATQNSMANKQPMSDGLA